MTGRPNQYDNESIWYVCINCFGKDIEGVCRCPCEGCHSTRNVLCACLRGCARHIAAPTWPTDSGFNAGWGKAYCADCRAVGCRCQCEICRMGLRKVLLSGEPRFDKKVRDVYGKCCRCACGCSKRRYAIDGQFTEDWPADQCCCTDCVETFAPSGRCGCPCGTCDPVAFIAEDRRPTHLFAAWQKLAQNRDRGKKAHSCAEMVEWHKVPKLVKRFHSASEELAYCTRTLTDFGVPRPAQADEAGGR